MPARTGTCRDGDRTRLGARKGKRVRAHIGAQPPTNAAAQAAAGVPRPLRCPPALACSCSGLPPSPSTTASALLFAVALDDGKELPLKAECVPRAG